VEIVKLDKKNHISAVLICSVLMIFLGNLNIPHASTNHCDWSSDKPLVQAAACGDIEKVRSLLANGAEVNIKDKYNGASALILSIARGHIDAARLLLENGASVDATDIQGRTALTLATRNKKIEGVKLLISYGADLNLRDHNGRTPLETAFTYGCAKEIPDLLLRNGASEGLHEAFADAIALDCIDMRRRLIKSGADVNGKHHPIMIAARRGSLEAIKFLIGEGADVNAKDDGGTTALILATLHNHEEIIKNLIDSGADVNAVCRSSELLEIMVGAGSDRELITKTGVTAIMIAEKNQREDIVKMLQRSQSDEIN